MSLIVTWISNIKEVNGKPRQCMSLSTYYLEYGRHLARLRRRRRRRRRRAYAPTSNNASHDNHEKIHWWVSLDFHIWDAYGAPLGGSSKHLRVFLESLRQSSAIFVKFRKFSENVRERSSGLRNNFGKSSEKNITRRLEDMNFIFLWQKQYLLTRCARS